MKSSINGDILHQGNSIVSIEIFSDYSQPVVVKQASKRRTSRRITGSLEREYEMTLSLDTVEGVRKVLGQKQIDNQQALILEYIEGETLQDHIFRNKLDIRSRLLIAIDLAHILGEIRQQNIIHLDINSKNILIGKKRREVHFIDLGSAAFIDRNGNLKVQPDQALENLSYISPEQTGRINRALDERSDLYSLGVVLYELMTGQLPFDSKDPMEIVHHHIARVPDLLSEVSSDVPEVLSAIILKLLSKNAEDRYQSAAGLQNDLEKCLDNLSPEGSMNDFPLGETDYANHLRFSQKLYGRDRELIELENAFESVCRDASSIIFVGGYSGIGKTALIQEIQQPVSEKGGYYIHGKFDQLVTTPYAGITQALALFVSQILTQTETQLTAWRSKILEAVGTNGRVLTDVVPSLEFVIGLQPEVPDSSGQEAQNRFNYVFQCFFEAIARSEHPICFFLDDLQWIDPGSLNLLKNLFSNPYLAHLLVIGAYRDNEVHEDHPLMMLIADLEKAGANLKQISLQKLSEADVQALISDTLQSNQDESQELSSLVYSQTNGNPFFTRQVLHNMEDQDLISLDSATGNWHWDMDTLRDQDVTASVVELLVGKLKELPADIQETLKVAACIGNQFDIAALKVVTEIDDDTILDHVHKMVTAGLIWEREDRCYFVHDRVQEAAFALVPMKEKDRLHLTIGRLLLKRHRASDDERDLYKIVDQLNHGLHLVEDDQERLQIARLNLQMAQAARKASAFVTGLSYAQAGIELLGENSWEQDYSLSLALQDQAAFLALAVGDILAMEHHKEQVLQFGRNPLDLARVQGLHIEFLLASNRFDEAVDFGLDALRNLGQDFPSEPEWAFTIKKFSESLEHLEQTPPDYLSIPRLYDQDPELLAVSEIMLPVGLAALIIRPALAPLIDIHSLELSIERQLLPEHTPWRIAAVGVFANSLLGKNELAYRYGETAVELASRADFPIYAPLHIHTLYNHFWHKPLREGLDLYDRALQSAREYGNNEFIANATQAWSNHAFYASIELVQVEERSLRLRAFLDAIQYVSRSRWVNIQVTAAQALRGSSSARVTTWLGTPFDDNRDLPELHRVEDQFGLLFAYCAKAWVATLFGDHNGVKEYSDLSRSFLVAGLSGLEKATLAFICGLRYARELRVTPDRPESEQALQEQLGLLERFAGLAPMNFAHKLSLVQAEVHRARGEVLPAMRAYEKASQGARENDYLNEAGLAHVLAAEFYQDLGLHQAALHNVEQAAQAWRSWGADALVESLSQRLPDLFVPIDSSLKIASDTDKLDITSTQPISSIQLDLDSITSVSQMLSAETDLEQLLSKMITLVLANSGAETAVLLLKQDNEWFVQARGDVRSQDQEVLLNKPLDSIATDGTGSVPESVHLYCRRSKEVLVVGDARSDDRFAKDKTVQVRNIKSMACIPVMAKGECKSMLYLENCQVPDTFSEDRIELLKHLSSQFGISVENALLYTNLNQKMEAVKESESRFRSVVENANETIVVTQDQVVKYCNEQVRELTGYSPEEIRSLGFGKFIHPEDLKMVLREYQDRVSGKRPTSSYSTRIIIKNGQEKHVFINSALVNWDGKPATLAMLTDITELKQTEEELSKSEEHFRKLMEQSPLPTEILNTEGKITRVNPAWSMLWGISEAEAAETIEVYNMMADQQLIELGIMPLVERAFSGETITLPLISYSTSTSAREIGLSHIKGNKVWIQSHLYAVKDTNGEVEFVVNTYLDLTDLKKAEDEVLKQREILARAGRANSFGQLTGSIAHELNQPLAGILSNAQATEILIQQGNLEEDELQEIMADIVSDTKRAGQIIRNLREMYKEQKVKFIPIDINTEIEKTLQLLHSEFIMQHIELMSELGASLPPVNGNRIQIQQVLVNLIMNSSQAMSRVAKKKRRLHVASASDGNMVRVWIDDNGTGIKTNIIDKIFEPLTTWKTGGTGMGLAISNSIIESHGGKMWAENRPEGGARVGFVIPILKESE